MFQQVNGTRTLNDNLSDSNGMIIAFEVSYSSDIEYESAPFAVFIYHFSISSHAPAWDILKSHVHPHLVEFASGIFLTCPRVSDKYMRLVYKT